MSSLRKLLTWAAGGLGASLLPAQTVTLTGSFSGTTMDSGWSVGGSGYTPTLTAPSIDTAGNGWLRLTSAGTNQATYAVNTNSFVSKNATITASFNYVSYGGTGADGITFFLADASKTFSVGAYGGSLGYAQKTAAGGATDINGMNGGYIGLGIDEFGNYANATEGRIGGTGSTPDAVSVRGPGQGLTGYDYLGGTGTLATSLDSSGSTRPTPTTFQVIITATNQLTVYMDVGATGNFTTLYNIDLSGYTRPDSLVMGFTGSTGGSTNIHEVQAVSLASVVANLWTNLNGDSQWGTANDWYGSPSGAVPPAYADVLLDNTYVSTAQSIDVGTNRTIRSLQIDAPFAYTLNNGTLTFNRGGIPGPSGIFVSQTHGSASHTVNSALVLDNAIQIQNNSAGTLALNGAITTASGKGVEFNGTGATTASGVISGAGALSQTGTGTTTLSGANTYSGGTTIKSGTLNANHSTALGSSGVTLSGGTLGSTNNSTVGNTITLTGNAGLSGLTTSGTLTQSGGNRTLTMTDATQSGAVNLSNNTTARTLTVQVDTGTSAISGIIANGGGSSGGNLTKTGAGTLALSGANTYTGTTTISAGTIQLGANNVLADTSSLNIASGTLDLNGNSDKVGTLKFSDGATLDFGTTSGANSFVFSNLDATSTGVLTVSNYDGPDSTNFNGSGDFLGTTTASLATALLNQIYFAGYGAGSLENVSLTNAGNGLGNAYRIVPNAAAYTVWDGLRDNGNTNNDANWNTSRNWVGDSAPSFNTSTRLSFGTATVPSDRQTADMNGSRIVNAIRFEDVNIAFTLTGTNGSDNETLNFSGTLPSLIQLSASNQALIMDRISWNANGVIDTSGAGTLTLGNGVSGNSANDDGRLYGTGNITKLGTGGRLILNADNSNWTGALTISQGIVEARASGYALGSTSGATSVAEGAALQLNTGGLTFGETLTLAGDGTDGTGALRNIATTGTNTLNGAITLSGHTSITADTGGTLAVNGGISATNKNLTLGGAGNLSVGSSIATGTGEVILNGSGTTTFSGAANTYTGDTTVNSGTLALSKAANTTAIAGNLVVAGGTVNQTASGQINTAATVTVASGSYNLTGTGVTQTLQTLNTSTGSNIALGTSSVLTVNGSGISTINGTVSGSGSVVTDGTGSVYLGGANTYSGGTTIGSVTTAAHNTSLGSGSVVVGTGGNLQVQGGVTLANSFNLTGSGTNANDGAIENFSGNNTLSGNIALGGASRIQSSSGTLTLSNAGTLTGTGHALSIGGNGNTILNRGINTGTGGSLTKNGSGTLTLNAASNYTGATSLAAGTTRLGVANAFASSSGITVATGAILDLDGLNQNISNLQGGGAGAGGTIEFDGATLTLTGGASSFGGDFSGSGTIVINAGQSLTLTDSFNAANINIVLNGGSLFLGNGLNHTFGNLTVNTGTTSVIDFGTSGATTAQFDTVNVTGAGNLNVNNWTDSVDYFLAHTSPGAQGTSPINKVVFAGHSGGSTKWLPYGGGNGQLTPVPEPATYGALLLGGATGLVLLRRQRFLRR